MQFAAIHPLNADFTHFAALVPRFWGEPDYGRRDRHGWNEIQNGFQNRRERSHVSYLNTVGPEWAGGPSTFGTLFTVWKVDVVDRYLAELIVIFLIGQFLSQVTTHERAQTCDVTLTVRNQEPGHTGNLVTTKFLDNEKGY